MRKHKSVKSVRNSNSRTEPLAKAVRENASLPPMPIALRMEALRSQQLISHIPGASLEACARAYAEIYQARERAGTLDELIARRLLSLANTFSPARTETIQGAKRHYRLLTDFIPGCTNISEITSEQLRLGILNLSARPARLEKARSDEHVAFAPSTIGRVHSNWCALFNLARKEWRLHNNPMETVDRPKIFRRTAIQVLTPQDVKALLAAAGQLAPELVPVLAIAAFAGLRRLELLHLNWEDINLAEGWLYVNRDFSWLSKRRVPTRDNLAAWLRPYASNRGLVVCPNTARALDRTLKSIRMRAGIEKCTIDALRHSFGTYHFARFGPIETMDALGYSSRGIVDWYYFNRATDAAANQYFDIFPAEATSR